MRMLFFCYPYYKKKLHLNHTNQHLVFATDELARLLVERGHHVDIVSFAEQVPQTFMRSKLKGKRLDEVELDKYDMYYHAFRDPTMPEILEVMDRKGLLRWDYGKKKVLNHINNLRNHHKWNYLPILYMNGVGAKVYNDMSYDDAEWGIFSYGSVVSKCKKYIRTCAYNNNREEYSDRKNAIFTEYIDNASAGIRSFFRMGFSMGKCCSGWWYAGPESMDTQKGGSCKHKIPFTLPPRYSQIMNRVMNDLGIDLCHFEGMFVGEKMYIFDINPYPVSYGETLTIISEEIVDNILDYGGWK
jgi:hypothetical protein